MASLNISSRNTKLFIYKPTYTKYSNTELLFNQFVESFNAEQLSFQERNHIIKKTVLPLCNAGYVGKPYLLPEYIDESLTNNEIIIFLTKNDNENDTVNTSNFISLLTLRFLNKDTVEIDVLTSVIIYKYGGSNILTYLLRAMRESGIRLCILKSLNTSFKFYQRYGFTYLGRKTNKNTTELYFGFDTFTDKIPDLKNITINKTVINHIRSTGTMPVSNIFNNVGELEEFIINKNINNNVNFRRIPVNIMNKRKEGTRNNKNNPRWYIKKNKTKNN
jgi:hypothetical protein